MMSVDYSRDPITSYFNWRTVYLSLNLSFDTSIARDPNEIWFKRGTRSFVIRVRLLIKSLSISTWCANCNPESDMCGHRDKMHLVVRDKCSRCTIGKGKLVSLGSLKAYLIATAWSSYFTI